MTTSNGNDPDLGITGEGHRQRNGDGERLVPANEVAEIVSKRIGEVNAKHDREIADLKLAMVNQQTANQQTANPPPAPAKVYSRAELAVAVEKNQISEEKANEIFDRQQEQRIKDGVLKEVGGALQAHQQNTFVQNKIAAYKEHLPDINSPGTKAYQDLQQEIQTQMQFTGQANSSPALELQALRVLFGDEGKLRPVGEHERETHQDTHFGGDQNGGNQQQGQHKLKLTQAEQSYYQKAIDNKVYKDWDAVADELKFSNQGLRERSAARHGR